MDNLNKILSKEEKQKLKEAQKELKKQEKEKKKAEKAEKKQAGEEKKEPKEKKVKLKAPTAPKGEKKEKKEKKAKAEKPEKQKKEIKLPPFLEKLLRGRKKSILVTLLGAFLLPVLLMIALGVVSYQTASSAVLEKYEESAVSTVSAVGDYFDLVCSGISSKALEMVTNSDVGDYYDQHYKDTDTEALKMFKEAKSILSNAQATNKNILSCTVIPESSGYISTISGGMKTETPLADFYTTDEGKFFVENPKTRTKWFGYNDFSKDFMEQKEEKHAMTYIQRFAMSETYLAIEMDMKVAEDMLTGMDFGEGSVKALVAEDGREVVFIQEAEEAEGEEAKEETAETEEAVEEAKVWFVGNEFYETSKQSEEAGSCNVKIDGDTYVYIYTPVGKTGSMICALIPQSNLLGAVGNIRTITVIMVLLAAVAALGIGLFISTGISKTVKDMSKGLSAVAEGDLSKDFKTKRQDEFKTLTGSLNDMLKSMRVLMLDMKEFGAKVNDMSGDVSDKTVAINSSMQDVARAMDEVARGVQSQAEDTEKSNENMITFSEAINAVSEQTKDMGGAADKAIDAVDKGKVIVQELSEKSDTTVSLTKVLVEDIDAVQKSSEEIKGFVDVINSIAEQTNLLSLNASIEAARAGEAGRGFAVVAEEIRKLADQSKQSGNRIREIVENIGSTTDKTTVSAKKAEDMVNEQAKALEETVDVFSMIHSCVGELVDGIRIVTEKLEESMSEKENVQNSLQNISSVSEEVAASTQEVTATLGEQVSVIENLKEEVEQLREGARNLDKSIERFKI